MLIFLYLFFFIVLCILNENIFISFCYSQEYHCAPSKRKLVGKFLVQQWINAQNEISSSSVKAPTLREIDTIMNINSCNNGVRLFYTLKGSIIPYIAMWKCASDGITQNLKRITLDKNFLNYGVRNTAEVDRAIEAMREVVQILSNSLNRELQYFTFVRDPFQRFIAGFVESIHRSLHPISDQCHPEEKIANLVGYKSAAAAHQRINFSDPDTGLFRINEEVVGLLLDKVFSLKHQMALPGHFYPIAGTLFSYPNISHIGHLETFAADWERIMLAVYGEPVVYNSRLGDHPTAENFPPNQLAGNGNSTRKKDPDDARKSLKNFLKANQKYTRAICHMLLIDYVCLPEYSLPVECQFLNQSRAVAFGALGKDKMLPAVAIDRAPSVVPLRDKPML